MLQLAPRALIDHNHRALSLRITRVCSLREHTLNESLLSRCRAQLDQSELAVLGAPHLQLAVDRDESEWGVVTLSVEDLEFL